MDKVNIVTATTCKGPARQEAVGKWLIEYIHDGEVSTKDGTLYRESITGNELTLQLLANAVYVVSKSDVVFETVEVRLDQKVIANAFMNQWIDKWVENDWKTAKGEDVANSDTWKKLYAIMDSTSKRFIVTDHRSRYTDWLKYQSQTHLDVIKSKRELRNKLENAEKH